MSTKSMDATKVLKKLRGGKPLALSQLLRSLRLCDELTQLEFAKKLGISKQNLSDIENGRKGISPGRAALFAKKLSYDQMIFVKLALKEIFDKNKAATSTTPAAVVHKNSN
jgi:transcriptional regulator with XRE-family HTH domain